MDLSENKVPFGLMSVEEQKFLYKCDKKITYYNLCGNWSPKTYGTFKNNSVYRTEKEPVVQNHKVSGYLHRGEVSTFRTTNFNDNVYVHYKTVDGVIDPLSYRLEPLPKEQLCNEASQVFLEKIERA